MVAKVAALRKTSVALEQQRQQGLAAEEQRRREEAERLRLERLREAEAHKPKPTTVSSSSSSASVIMKANRCRGPNCGVRNILLYPISPRPQMYAAMRKCT